MDRNHKNDLFQIKLSFAGLHSLAKMTQQFLFPHLSPKSLSLIGSLEGGARGSNFGLVLVSIALWEISVVADPVISSAC